MNAPTRGAIDVLFPYSTDAPLYHWPIATVLLIAINVAAFCGQMSTADQGAAYILEFGNGLHPVEWITSNFLHASLSHLAGNMVFLWVSD